MDHKLGNVYESRIVGCGGTWIAECSCGERVKAISEEMVRIRFKEHATAATAGAPPTNDRGQ